MPFTPVAIATTTSAPFFLFSFLLACSFLHLPLLSADATVKLSTGSSSSTANSLAVVVIGFGFAQSSWNWDSSCAAVSVSAKNVSLVVPSAVATALHSSSYLASQPPALSFSFFAFAFG